MWACDCGSEVPRPQGRPASAGRQVCFGGAELGLVETGGIGPPGMPSWGEGLAAGVPGQGAPGRPYTVKRKST